MRAVRVGVAAVVMPLAMVGAGAMPAGAAPDPEPVIAVGRFMPYSNDQTTITYDPKLVPSGATAGVAYLPGRDVSSVRLQVQGLLPDRKYGAHVHTKRCGAKPEDAGPHYQHKQDPVTPSTDPRYANARNEVWLDFTTDAHGNASSVSTLNWKFTDRHPQSIVIHADHTHTDPGHAGTAGARLACISVNF
ncbi:superoxide dismutase family protein [Sphaerisporangium fuscum]|uniref:superoxide dismutase family protein n=1 Tax=Sphaerisporangium fuscum TaxID=2835868 RepID=UPI001BDBD4B4|nr:superoxide dismutase family protein [Sphaerisporangium fuscum]